MTRLIGNNIIKVFWMYTNLRPPASVEISFIFQDIEISSIEKYPITKHTGSKKIKPNKILI